MAKRKRTPRVLMNQGGKWDGHTVEFTNQEVREVLAFAQWKDPLKTHRRTDKSNWIDTSEHTPVIPNWTHIRHRNLWVTHFSGFTMEIGPTLTGDKWLLYFEGDRLNKVEPGPLEELKEIGTAFLLLLDAAKNQA